MPESIVPRNCHVDCLARNRRTLSRVCAQSSSGIGLSQRRAAKQTLSARPTNGPLAPPPPLVGAGRCGGSRRQPSVACAVAAAIRIGWRDPPPSSSPTRACARARASAARVGEESALVANWPDLIRWPA
jgi:hypothetical protein